MESPRSPRPRWSDQPRVTDFPMVSVEAEPSLEASAKMRTLTCMQTSLDPIGGNEVMGGTELPAGPSSQHKTALCRCDEDELTSSRSSSASGEGSARAEDLSLSILHAADSESSVAPTSVRGVDLCGKSSTEMVEIRQQAAAAARPIARNNEPSRVSISAARRRYGEATARNLCEHYQQPDWVSSAELWNNVLEYVAVHHVWVDDESRTACEACARSFVGDDSVRRHHCRNCGLIFCNDCAPYRETALDIKSSVVKVLTKPSAIWRSMLYYSGLSYVGAATFGRRAGYRRCNKCHSICGALVSQNGPALEEMMAGAMGFRHLQYQMPYHELPSDEVAYLRADLLQFRGHSKYTVQILLKVIDWSDDGDVASALDLITTTQTAPPPPHLSIHAASPSRSPRLQRKSRSAAPTCKELFCTRGCRPELQPDDVLILLAHLPDHAFAARRPLLALLNTDRCPDDRLLCYLTTLVCLLAKPLWNNPADGTIDQSELARFLISRATQVRSIDVLSKLYWSLETAARSSSSQPLSSAYSAMQKKLLIDADPTHAHELVRSHQFVDALAAADSGAADPADGTLVIVNSLHESVCQRVIGECGGSSPRAFPADVTDERLLRLPLDPRLECCLVKCSSVSIKDSQARPFVLHCDCRGVGESERRGVDLMVKHNDDLRKDQLVVSTMRLMVAIVDSEIPDLSSKLFAAHEAPPSLNDLLADGLYNVLPVSASTGLIQLVPSSKTLYSIMGPRGLLPIQQFLMDHNKAQTNGVDLAQRRYVLSLASYIVFTYMLGIGDRHLENVMMRTDGCIFHIDFGYILGEEPTKAVNEGVGFRLCQPQILAMGGPDHSNYRIFKEICAELFACLRRHAAVIYTNLSPVIELNILDRTPLQVQQHFDACCGYTTSEWDGGQSSVTFITESDAKAQFSRGLQDAETRENYYKINDIVHKLAKNRVGVSSSVSAGVISVSTGVRSALGGVYHTVAQSILPVTASADGTAAQSEQEEAIRQLQHIMNDME